MGFLELLAIFVVSAIIGILLRPKIEPGDGPGDFRPPEPREGEPIPVIFGTVKISPAVTWFGDVHANRVFKKESTLLGLVSTEVPLGFEYEAGMQLVLCHGPIDSFLDIHIGEYHIQDQEQFRGTGGTWNIFEPPGGWPAPTSPPLPASFADDPTRFDIYLPLLFGGNEEGGGIVGQMDLAWGSNVQGPNDYLAVWWGADIVPNYRGLCYAVLRRMNMGKSASPQPWHFVLKRIPDVLGQTASAEITDGDGNGTANAAECIYDLLTNAVWGVGMRTDRVDIASFQAAGATLFTEGLGYNGILNTRSEAWSQINHILQHVNGVVYQDPTTGKISMKLIRDDYTLAALPELNASNSTLHDFKRGSWAESVNETAVKYTDIKRRFSEGVAQAQNLAAIQSMNEIVSTTISLPGLSTHSLAQDAAARSNRATSIPLTRGRIVTNRFAYAFHQGFVFKINFPDYGVVDLACRVVSINYGSLLEGNIEINWVQDPFAFINPYGDPEDLSDLEPCGPLSLLLEGYDPGTDPAAVFGLGEQTIFEAPYWHVGAVRRAWAHVGRATNIELYWIPFRSEQGLALQEVQERVEFAPVGTLDEDLAQTTDDEGVTMDVRTQGDMSFLTNTTPAGLFAGERLAMIGRGDDAEIIAWDIIQDLGGGIYRLHGVMRGVLDTVPDSWPQGARVYFYHNESGGESAFDVSSGNYAEDTNIQIRPVRVDSDGSQAEAETVPPVDVLLTNRALAPYPPGLVKLNGLTYDFWPSATTGDVTLSWIHRSRTEQTTIVAQHDPTAFTLEGTVDIEVLIEGLPVRSFLSQTGNSIDYDFADRESDDADLTKEVQFRITPVGSSSELGRVRVTPAFTMSA